MAIARLTGQDASGAGTTTATATYTSTPTQNNLMIAAVTNDSGSQTITGWTQAFLTGAARYASLFYKIAGAAESKTVTVTDAGASIMNIWIYEYSGLTTTSVLDQTAIGSGSGGTTASSGTTATTTVADELLIAVLSMGGSNTLSSVNNSFTIRNSSTGAGGVADRIVATTGAYSTTFTTSASTFITHGTGIATFKQGTAPVTNSGFFAFM